MSDSRNHLEEEFDSYITDLNGWIQSVQAAKFTTSQEGVVQRFVRDCNTLIEDLNATTTPRVHDLNDFVDRRNSLETQYYLRIQDAKSSD